MSDIFFIRLGRRGNLFSNLIVPYSHVPASHTLLEMSILASDAHFSVCKRAITCNLCMSALIEFPERLLHVRIGDL